MPCDRIIYNRLELKLADRKKLIEALKAEGIQFNEYGRTVSFYDKQTGISGEIGKSDIRLDATGQRATDFVNRIKRAYSTQVVKSTARTFKWNLKQVGPNRFVAQRRF